MHFTSLLVETSAEDRSAREFLGDDHALVRVLHRTSVVIRQLLIVTVVFVCSARAWLDGAHAAIAVIAAAAVVDAVLALQLASLRWLARTRVRSDHPGARGSPPGRCASPAQATARPGALRRPGRLGGSDVVGRRPLAQVAAAAAVLQRARHRRGPSGARRDRGEAPRGRPRGPRRRARRAVATRRRLAAARWKRECTAAGASADPVHARCLTPRARGPVGC